MSRPVYCDYNATAPLRDKARVAMLEALDIGANPSSAHAGGRAARAVIERARATIAAGLDVRENELIFTGGGTESVATALWGARAADPCLRLWAADIEHECVLKQDVARSLAVDASGYISLSHLREAMQMAQTNGERPLLSLTLANNETGIMQPVAEATAMIHAFGGLVHCDAIQAAGKIDVRPERLEVDYMSVSAHKLGGPQGVGALYVRAGAPFRARQTGGAQESGRRAGTENLAGIAGFGSAFAEAVAGIDAMSMIARRRDAMEQKLQKAVPDLVIYGKNADRLPNTSLIGLSGFAGATQMMALDLQGVCASAGAACASGKHAPSRTLMSMGVAEADAASVIRASFGWNSAPADFDRLAEVWIAAVAMARPEALAKGARNRHNADMCAGIAI